MKSLNTLLAESINPVQITQRMVDQSCLKDGGRLLKPIYRNTWTPDNPTFGYCYIVSEALYHYIYTNHNSYVMNLGPNIGTHWFLALPTKKNIIDLTGNQFKDFDIRDYYHLAKPCGFFKGAIKTSRGFISRNGFEMAKLLDVVDMEQ